MKKIPRRDKLKIYGDILSALYVEARGDKIVLTRVQHKTNVPFDRLKGYIAELEGLGLVQQEPNLRLTEKGKQYLSEYEKVLEFMTRMGLTYS
jgi:predicted transcriptional regulator